PFSLLDARLVSRRWVQPSKSCFYVILGWNPAIGRGGQASCRRAVTRFLGVSDTRQPHPTDRWSSVLGRSSGSHEGEPAGRKKFLFFSYLALLLRSRMRDRRQAAVPSAFHPRARRTTDAFLQQPPSRAPERPPMAGRTPAGPLGRVAVD